MIPRRKPLKRTGLKRKTYAEVVAALRRGNHPAREKSFASMLSHSLAKQMRRDFLASPKLITGRTMVVSTQAQAEAVRREYPSACKVVVAKRLRARSPKRAADDRKWEKAKAEHLAEFPKCQYPIAGLFGSHGTCCHRDAVDVHHRGGRNGPLLWTKKYLASACRAHHNLAKDDIRGSLANGWVLRISSEEIRRIREEELQNS